MGRVRVDGKQFSVEGGRFIFRGVTYGTFAPRGDGAQFPEREQVRRDFSLIRESGFSVVRTYTAPPDDVIDLAAEEGLRLLPDAFYPDWRYLVGASDRDRRRVTRAARDEIGRVARRLAQNDAILALSLGNEIPTDVLRWVGTKKIASVISALAETVRDEESDMLVTYANYPSAEYLPLECLDFLTFNVFLERQHDFRRYLTRLHHLAGDRPLVLAEVGLDAGTEPAGEERQATTIDWMLRTALERGVAGTCIFSWTDEWWVGGRAVEGWNFGLTRGDRSARPSLAVARRWNSRRVGDLHESWPSMSVVICAYNAASTLDECLRHTCALEYPNLEVMVVDDGSTDDTAAIAARYPRVRLLRIPHGGLSVARNEGFRAATGDIVAYLDSDAYPTAEWPYYLALGFDEPTVAAVGGPNVPPPNSARGARQVARAPGGPIHVLLGDDRAEHVPGCNMAFWKQFLVDTGGFDPVYTAAGDDVDLCWRVLDRGWEIGFHPAALVWHHRRSGLRAYLRQQRGYGRSEALVEARHPDRFTSTGTARWRGRIYDSFAPALGRQRVYRGLYGSAAYQSVYRSGGYALDLAHQVGVPVAALFLLTAPLAAFSRVLLVPVVASLVFIAALIGIDVARSGSARSRHDRALGFRFPVALMHVLQPLARWWGRVRHRDSVQRELPDAEPLPGPGHQLPRGVLLLPEDRSRPELAAAIVVHLRRAGLRVLPATGWEDYDARVVGSSLVTGDVVTTNHPQGCVQVRVRRRLYWDRTLLGSAILFLTAVVHVGLAVLFAAAGAAEVARGAWRTGPGFRRLVIRACSASSGSAAIPDPGRSETAV